MYDSDLDTPCVVRSSNLCQELGLISNLFSDKTGTLTRNEMKFVKCIVDGMNYDITTGYSHSVFNGIRTGHFGDGLSIEGSGSLYDFLRCLILCHTVILEKNGVYRAESPDELALVQGVSHFECRMLERNITMTQVELIGEKQEHAVLAINAFNSDRKRMSVLVRGSKSGQHFLLCKGADSTVLPLCRVSGDELKAAEKSLFELSCSGLRTLCIAMKPLSAESADEWLAEFRRAQSSLVDRENLLSSVAGKIESDLTFLGITAVEDQLQEEVPEVIADLAKAGIVLWMLTGDKQETAISIGKSCNLVTRNTKLLFITGMQSVKELEICLEQMLDYIRVNFVSDLNRVLNEKFIELGLVIDGQSLSFFQEDDKLMNRNLMNICSSSRTVIACRLTPRQKQVLVLLVKRESKHRSTCLAIGDGANDVSMILEADVGVGIIGKEGKQAANNADFAIGQFKFLRRLLLIHGRWNYIRRSVSFLYCAHKCQVLTVTMFWYNFYSAVSGTSIYESWVHSSFNVVLGLPIIFGV